MKYLSLARSVELYNLIPIDDSANKLVKDFSFSSFHEVVAATNLIVPIAKFKLDDGSIINLKCRWYSKDGRIEMGYIAVVNLKELIKTLKMREKGFVAVSHMKFITKEIFKDVAYTNIQCPMFSRYMVILDAVKVTDGVVVASEGLFDDLDFNLKSYDPDSFGIHKGPSPWAVRRE